MRSNTRRTNRSADKIAAIYRELRMRREESVLLVLLDDSDRAVRSWAASHAPEFAPSEGEPVLEALVAGDHPPLVGFTAEVTLEEWRAGRLRFL